METSPNPTPSAPKVFISYSHDSDDHRENVLCLSERLREEGFETLLDQYVNGSPVEGWPRWMQDQIDAADRVLVVCTETYYRRFRGHEEPGKGKGVDWEGALITQEIYHARSKTLKFIPVFLSAANPDWVPEPLRSGTHHSLISEDAIQGLCDFLLGVAGVEARPVGGARTRERRKGASLRFGNEQNSSSERPADISRILKYAPAELIGREHELNLLTAAWTGDLQCLAAYPVVSIKHRPRVLTFVALGGEGKTSLVAKWAAELAAKDWAGCDAVFAWSFYSQGTRDQVAASSDLFLKEALLFFGNDADKEFAASSAGAFEKGQHLARIVGQRRCLLILDGLEPLQYAPTSPTPGELKDQGIRALLRSLATSSQGFCIVTTRYSIPDLKAFRETSAPEVDLLRLCRKAGVHLLKILGVKGNERRHIPVADDDPNSEKVNEFEKLVEDVKGHALTLTLFGGFLKRAFHGDIRQRDRVKFEKADEKMDGGHAFRTMAAYEQWLLRDGGDEGQREVALLRLMGLFDRPADVGCLMAVRSEIIPDLTEPLVRLADDDWEYCLSGLEAAKLLTANRDSSGALVLLDAHPHLREYFAQQLRKQYPDAWRAAHRQIYQHLCATASECTKYEEQDAIMAHLGIRSDKPQPTLEDLQPLYQAIVHGCHAGLQQECAMIYRDRILRGKENYSITKLGSIGSDLCTMACFFEEPWSCPSTALNEAAQAWLLNNSANCLRSLGRLSEALQPVRAAIEPRLKLGQFDEASIAASNLSALELTLGDVAGALRHAEQCVIYADRSDAAFWKIACRTTHAEALHQKGLSQDGAVKAGGGFDANMRFLEAEQMQAELQPDHPLLYAVQGFQYCELLLAPSERVAWRYCMGPWPPESTDTSCVLKECCRAVSQRTSQTLKWSELWNHGLLSIALGHLTLGRTAFYEGILESSAKITLLPRSDEATLGSDQHRSDLKSRLENARLDLNAAVSGLRRANTAHWLPSSLLTRAWLRFHTGACTRSESAQEDLDEAWEIAERGPMRLHMADIHLHRARLFFREANYPESWGSPKQDLAAARKLIESCGYGRRLEELQDAEAAILGKH